MSTEKGNGKSRLKVKINSWKTVGSWTWGAGDEICAICQMPLDGCSPESNFPGDDCPIVYGSCDHPFHLVCINKWINSGGEATDKCPLCRKAWSFRED
ncbi:anaphase-promoting complex subunit 11 [Anaeramoeba flamelloides]|uniref:Anaphase-promoting complex subunit 11 n=1 Tax=Anaeramoeba flamelloides TaxID=1746091 RepID=A0AAV7ZFD2_9EUKA|nr:anaphase-promoting complex subunit [Anaeramoeba flamelloides]KAJ3448077.1 anaphase-promoting complex subunit [Anaeramoeba flamelloides]KAJ6235815.1 anaphase-promoting complex subunit 11 [Anaeramoeba flamelloides]KAJ6243573.1 anaphase-promoting complex subunit 11 [Anaeramoeba flamelloides]